ncbi:MAG: SET domain-containing protein [Acidobacteria bacterium]|nr:SET domain-containing protein [Acidobacteriota bacterium]MBI3421585.1 SET domain-containing protein [Acidobacteriota bacterium]
MLLVKAQAGKSAIHGIGLIAHEFIPAGTRVWAFQPGFDLVFTVEQLTALSATAQAQVRHYAFFDAARRVYVLSSDDDRFTNHADDPNTQEEGGYDSYAIRDIQAGEEITWCYRGWGELDFLPSRVEVQP